MAEENISQEFRLKNMEEAKNYFIKEIDQNKLISNKHKKFYITLDYAEQFLNVAPAVTECISVSTFALLLGIPIESKSSALRLKIFAINAGIKKHKSIIKKKVKKHDKIVLLQKQR